jgi:hypothetical protein
MTKFYIATGLENIKKHNLLRDSLVEKGHQITYDWTITGNEKSSSLERLNEIAHVMLEDGVKGAELIVVILPGGKGTHTELGAGLAYGKQVLLYSDDPECFMACEKTCGFYYHTNVSQFTEMNGLMRAFEKMGSKTLV